VEAELDAMAVIVTYLRVETINDLKKLYSEINWKRSNRIYIILFDKPWNNAGGKLPCLNRSAKYSTSGVFSGCLV
jgi:hypothetical protein